MEVEQASWVAVVQQSWRSVKASMDHSTLEMKALVMSPSVVSMVAS